MRKWGSETDHVPVVTSTATLAVDSMKETGASMDQFDDTRRFQTQEIDVEELFMTQDLLARELDKISNTIPPVPARRQEPQEHRQAQSRNPGAVFARAVPCGGSANGGCDYLPGASCARNSWKYLASRATSTQRLAFSTTSWSK